MALSYTTITDWFGAHHVAAALTWLFVTAVVTFVFKPRTPEEYTAMNPRLAAFLKLVGSLGIDAPKLLEALAELFARPKP